MSEVAGTSSATIRAAARRRHCENGAHNPQRNSGSCTKMSQLMNAREREDAIWGQAAAPGLAERVGPLSGNQRGGLRVALLAFSGKPPAARAGGGLQARPAAERRRAATP